MNEFVEWYSRSDGLIDFALKLNTGRMIVEITVEHGKCSFVVARAARRTFRGAVCLSLISVARHIIP